MRRISLAILALVLTNTATLAQNPTLEALRAIVTAITLEDVHNVDGVVLSSKQTRAGMCAAFDAGRDECLKESAKVDSLFDAMMFNIARVENILRRGKRTSLPNAFIQIRNDIETYKRMRDQFALNGMRRLMGDPGEPSLRRRDL